MNAFSRRQYTYIYTDINPSNMPRRYMSLLALRLSERTMNKSFNNTVHSSFAQIASVIFALFNMSPLFSQQISIQIISYFG